MAKMKPFKETKRKHGGWLESHLAHWTEENTAFISVVFSWDLREAKKLTMYYRSLGFRVRAGGPAVALNPGAVTNLAELGGEINALLRHNPRATFTSRGCPRRCKFCAVPKLEGSLVELSDWPVKSIICDNNLLACSTTHFDRVVDRLKAANVKGVDFNQGLDARLLTKHHANRIAELDLRMVRLAWDDTRLESQFIAAWETLRRSGIPKRKIAVYVLIGFNDTLEDAAYRLRVISDLNSYTVPMRYQPINTPAKNAYVAPGWTDWQLKAFMRYWSSLRLCQTIPFSEWMQRYRRIDIGNLQPSLITDLKDKP